MGDLVAPLGLVVSPSEKKSDMSSPLSTVESHTCARAPAHTNKGGSGRGLSVSHLL